MKKLLLALSILFPIWASAQESETVASEYDLPTIVERIMDKRDSIKNDGYQIRKIKSHINLEFAGSGNAYFTEGKFDEAVKLFNKITPKEMVKMYNSIFNHSGLFKKYSFDR